MALPFAILGWLPNYPPLSGMSRIAFCVHSNCLAMARDLFGTSYYYSPGRKTSSTSSTSREEVCLEEHNQNEKIQDWYSGNVYSIASVEEERCSDSRNRQALLHISGCLSYRSASFPFFTIHISVKVLNHITSILEDDIPEPSLSNQHGKYDVLQPSRHGPAYSRTSRSQ